MQLILTLVVLIFLAIISIIDLKTKTLPAVLTTSLLLIVLFVNYNNLVFGLIAFVFALLLTEASFIWGIADIKVITTLGLMASSTSYLFILIFSIVAIGVLYKIAARYIFKQKKEIAFTPSLFITFLILLITGGTI